MSSRALRTRQPRGSGQNTPSTPTPSRAPRRKSSKATTAAMKATPNGDELVGRLVEVAWPSDDGVVYYVALVLGCTRRNQHKVIYIEDESIETLQLGSGSPYRTWRPTESPSDNLVGARIRFIDSNPSESGESWFDFMRANPNRRSPPFEAHVYARVSDPDPSEVSGPHGLTPGNENYYRIVHAPNDYLTTVDLSSVDYVIVEPLKQPDATVQDTDQRPAVIGPDASADDADPAPRPDDDTIDVAPRPIDDTVDADIVSRDVPPARSRIRSNAAPSKTVDVIPDDQTLPENTSKRDVTRDDAVDDANPSTKVIKVSLDDSPNQRVQVKSEGASLVKKEPSEQAQDDDKDVEADATTKEDVLDLLNDVDDGPESAPDILRIPGTSDPTPITDDTNDATVHVALDVNDGPTPRSVPKTRRKVEDEDHDTASEDNKLVPIPVEPEETAVDDGEGGSQAGDYILLDTGDGGPRRKAYVTAYLPLQRSHFVTFCDAKGGTTQIKLTKYNHDPMDDKEVELLTRVQARQAVVPAPAPEPIDIEEDDGKPVDVDHEMESARPVPTKREKRKASLASKPTSTLSIKKKAKRSSSTMKILGKSAGKEIVSRCITVLWPHTRLIYVALVMGYSAETNQHMLLYMTDHCVEVLELKYREWELLARGKEPWNSSGMVGRRIYVWWPGEYEEEDKQEIAEALFGEGKTKVAYEAYILGFIGKTKYKIVYPCNEDCEDRELDAAKTEGASPAEKEWDLLEEGVTEVAGLPIIGWEA